MISKRHFKHTNSRYDVSTEDKDDIMECRCRDCYADGALTDTTLRPETKALKIVEADQKRDLYYTVAAPSLRPEMGDDVRVLALDMKRGPLSPLNTIKAALANVDSPNAITDLRRVLLETISGDGDLARLLEIPELTLVRERLMELTSPHTNAEHDAKVTHFGYCRLWWHIDTYYNTH
jgi:hypothetical protein